MFKNQEILNSYNFARQSDIVFSEIVTKKQFEMLNLKNVEIIDENEFTDSVHISQKAKKIIAENITSYIVNNNLNKCI